MITRDHGVSYKYFCQNQNAIIAKLSMCLINYFLKIQRFVLTKIFVKSPCNVLRFRSTKKHFSVRRCMIYIFSRNKSSKLLFESYLLIGNSERNYCFKLLKDLYFFYFNLLVFVVQLTSLKMFKRLKIKYFSFEVNICVNFYFFFISNQLQLFSLLSYLKKV